MRPSTTHSSTHRRRAALPAITAAITGLVAVGCGDGKPPSDPSPGGAVIHVDAASTATSPDGASWSSAYAELSAALAAADSGQEVWVAAGTYYPTRGADRTASFALVSEVSVYGGFAGTETDRADRDPAANVTVLSGDIDEDGLLDGENSYHVVRGADGAVLDGVTITMGYAQLSGSPPSDFASFDGVITVESGRESDEILRILTGVRYIAGGGMLNLQAAPTVRNCIFEGNAASKGGAVYNMVQRDYPGFGTYDAATFEGCVFRNNTATARGGAVNNDMVTDPTFISCQFLENTCDDKGGAIYSDLQCDAVLVNVLLAGNTSERGAALVSDGSSQPTLLYVSIVDNVASDIGGGLYQGTYAADSQVAGSPSRSNDPKLIKCLVLGNTSRASGSSIASWHDSALNVDGDSVVEALDGALTPTDHFLDPTAGDYEPTAAVATLGWSAGRDTAGWASEVTALGDRTYGTYPYTTTGGPGAGATYFVDASASGADTGADWANAFTDLQDALAAASAGDVVQVAKGTYRPTSTADREAAFVVRAGVSLIGGFPPGGGARDVAANPTALSGDIDLNGALDANNSYHVLVGGKDAFLDGLIVEQGYADGEWFHQRGGGLLILGDRTASNSVTLVDCTFRDNYALEGGGVACYDYASPTISGCAFEGNSAERGGALLLRAWSDATVEATTFSGNSSTDRGGAVYVDYGAWPTFSANCAFTGNSSAGYGGAVYIDDNASQRPETRPSFEDCSFVGNGTTADYGGAVFAYNRRCYATLSACSFSANSSAVDGADLGLRFHVEATLTGCTFSSLYADTTVFLTVR